jgi:cytochrome c-type biogenesis protein CcmH/NrfF
MTMRGPLPGRGWILWALVLLVLLGATTAIALNRRRGPQPLDYRPASVAPAAPLTLTQLRAV